MMDLEKLNVAFRWEVCPSDRKSVRYIVELTGYFSHDEVDIATELVGERLIRGDKSGYHFLLAETGGEVIGFSCFGPIPATRCSFDLYWIVVHPDFQGQALGRKLLMMSESQIRAAGGRQVYVETSARDQYESTRRFYDARGYKQIAILPDFYAPGDAKIMYVKILN